MSLVSWKLEKHMCRCCHNEGSFKNLGEPCINQDEVEEIYCEMLQECLDIRVKPVGGPLCEATFTICEDCILRLRDACSFKQQVLQCEQRFRDLCSEDVIKLATSYEVEVKQEASEEDITIEISKLDTEDDRFDLPYDDEDVKKTQIIKSGSKRSSKKPKAKEKVKPKKNTIRVQRIKIEEDRSEEAEKKAAKAPAAKRFKFRDTDYKAIDDAYQCSHCDKRYQKFESLKGHVKTKHYKIARYKCPYCVEQFMTPAPLAVHKLTEHNVDDRFRCNACKGVFNTKVQLRKHINIFHMLGERYKCPHCEYESFSFEGLYKHKFKHKTEKDYHCRFCKKAFLRKTTLDLHERIHTGDRRKVCAVCSKAFVQKASLNYHMAKHHPEVNF